MKTKKEIVRAYRKTRRELASVEKEFDFFMRSNRSRHERMAYAEKANVQYFALKRDLLSLRMEACELG